MTDVTVLDCTIRDGGYAIDFQWSAEDIADIVGGLAAAGVRYIEVGHGIGLGGSRASAPARCSDVEMTSVAASASEGARIGAFFIPGVGTQEDLREFRDAGGAFIRIGTDVSKSESAWPFVECARDLGLEVCYNFMKSYVVQPFELLRRALPLVERGASTVAVVDSAGGMLPDQVGQYVRVLRDGLDARVGFHGHNNLLLANANSLAAVQNGATIVDATLLGIGRGGGNAQTETLLVVLEKAGYPSRIDPLRISRLAERHVLPKQARLKGSSEMELLYGIAQFHSSYTKRVQDIAAEYDVPYQELILAVSRYAKEDLPESLVKEVADQLQRRGRVEIHFPKFHHRRWT